MSVSLYLYGSMRGFCVLSAEVKLGKAVITGWSKSQDLSSENIDNSIYSLCPNPTWDRREQIDRVVCNDGVKGAVPAELPPTVKNLPQDLESAYTELFLNLADGRIICQEELKDDFQAELASIKPSQGLEGLPLVVAALLLVDVFIAVGNIGIGKVRR